MHPRSSDNRSSPREVSRRAVVGTTAGLGLSGLMAGSTAAASTVPGFGAAKRCLLLYLWGSPSQLDTFDPKPDAPAEVRGEFRSIATAIPGVRIGEILPRTAGLLDKVTIARSLTHNYPIHGTAFATTAVPMTDLQLEGSIRDPRHWPFVGSVVDYLCERANPSSPPVPRNFGLPFQIGSRRRVKPGPFGGFLGSAYDPVWSEFHALGTKSVLRDSGAPDVPTKVIADPFLGILSTDRFEAVTTDRAVTLDQWGSRVALLEQLSPARVGAKQAMASAAFERHRAMARQLITSGKLRDALDVQQEPSVIRDRYGMTLFGQSCLAARRLLEAGGKFVTVCWDEFGLVNTGWDTHVHMRSRQRDELGPGFDNAFASLLQDLSERGMLESTAIVVVSEHGRTPRIQSVDGGGRDHWARAYSALFAGGGFAEGRVVGKTDSIGGEVVDAPISPKDLLATIFHVLGFDPETEIHDGLGRRYPIGGEGHVRGDLLA